MSKVYIGKIVGTHGIKGEIRIISDFPYKEKAFLKDTFLCIEEEKYKITGYRKHKNYDMITLEGYNDINEVLFLMKKKVYKEKETLNLADDEILDEELITYQVKTTDGKDGIIKEIFFGGPSNKIIRLEIEKEEILLPLKSPFIKKIDSKNKEIIIEIPEGM